MISGTIKLLTLNGKVISEKRYKGKMPRQKIMDRWEKAYSKKHPFLMIDIRPSTNVYRINSDGTNTKKKLVHKKELARPTIYRPPSTYSNSDIAGYGIAKELHNSTNSQDTP